MHCDPYYWGSNGQRDCLLRKISQLEEAVEAASSAHEKSLMETITRQGVKICELGEYTRRLEDQVEEGRRVISSLSKSLEMMCYPCCPSEKLIAEIDKPSKVESMWRRALGL
jgi:hypothetical protein